MKRNQKLFILVISVILLFITQLAVSIIPNQMPNTSKLFISLVVIVGVVFCLKLGNSEKLAKNTFFIILFLGIGISFIKPVQFGVDEETHLRWTIRLADGQLFTREQEKQPDWATVEKYDTLRNPAAEHAKNGFPNKFFSDEHKASTYSGKKIGINNISLIPNALGWKIGMVTTSRVAVAYYLGRIFNVIAYALMVCLAMKIGKKYREVLLLFAAFPTTLWIVSSFQYDWLFYSLSLMILAFITKFISEKESIRKKDLIFYLVTTTLMMFPKFPFILMGVVPLFISKRYYINVKDKIWYGISLIGSVLIAVGWYLQSTIVKMISNGTSPEVSTNITNKAGISYFIKHPLPIVRTFIRDVLGSFSGFSGSNTSNPPAPLQYVQHTSSFITGILPVIFTFLFILVTIRIKIKLDKTAKIFIYIGYLVISLAIIYALSGDNRVGYNIGELSISGVQFRYFYPILLSLPLLWRDWMKKIIPINEVKELEDESRITDFLQISMIYINVLILSLGMYTLVS